MLNLKQLTFFFFSRNLEKIRFKFNFFYIEFSTWKFLFWKNWKNQVEISLLGTELWLVYWVC